MSIKTGQFIKLWKIMQDNLVFSLWATEAFLEHSRTFMVEVFLQKKLTAESS